MDLAGLLFKPAVDISDTAIDKRRRKEQDGIQPHSGLKRK